MQTDITQLTMTAEAFEQFSLQPENAPRRLELIEGEVIELVSDSYASEIAAIILGYLIQYVRVHELGRVTGADGGYAVSDDRYIPDVAFISKARQPDRPHTAWNPVAPDLAVEVLSPGNTDDEIRIKVVTYLQAGTSVWVVDPDRQIVEVYVPGQPPVRATRADTLSGGDVLPGFSLAVSEVFPA